MQGSTRGHGLEGEQNEILKSTNKAPTKATLLSASASAGLVPSERSCALSSRGVSNGLSRVDQLGVTLSLRTLVVSSEGCLLVVPTERLEQLEVGLSLRSSCKLRVALELALLVAGLSRQLLVLGRQRLVESTQRGR